VVVDRGSVPGNLSSGCVIVDRGHCLVLHQCLYSSGLFSVRGTRAVTVAAKTVRALYRAVAAL
jgi:hypothetical protein